MNKKSNNSAELKKSAKRRAKSKSILGQNAQGKAGKLNDTSSNNASAKPVNSEKKDTFVPSRDAEKISALMEEKNQQQDKILRMAAEFENYKKRHTAELERITSTASQYLISDLLPILDDLDLLISNSRSNTEYQALIDGANMIRQKLYNIFQQRGLEAIEAGGQQFDPDIHEALMQQPTSEHEPGIVMGVQQVGYRLKGKLLRPSRVIVAKEPE